jgi:misacylated tRNA(Ala) deacylase
VALSETEELFREDSYRRTTDARVLAVLGEGVVLDRTVCYPTAGGQPGDSGSIEIEGAARAIVDTVYLDGRLVHRLGDGPGVAEGDVVTVALDWARRHRHMRVHSCLHLLCQAVGEPVTGGQIAADKGRLDFAIAGEVPTKNALDERLQAWIAEDRAIHHRWIDADELDRNPALVRTMSVAPPRTRGQVRLVEITGIDLQACGGTHVASTGEIGRVEVAKIENKGKQNRRFTVRLVDD